MYIILFIFLVPLLRAVAAQQSACVKWGNTFDVSLESANIIRNCNLPDGRKICCSAVNNSTASRGVGASYVPPKRPSNLSPNSQKARVSCVVEKQYMSSPQELRELAEADRIERIPGDKSLYMIEDRYHALMEYVTSDEFIRNSTLWLNRVKVHMSGVGTGEGEAEIGNSIDREFLSRFEFTRTCTSHGPAGERAADATTVTKWTEWIEPVGITARHPFGFATCRQSQQYYNTGGSRNKNGKAKPRVGRSNVDYVLLQSGAGLHRQTHTSSGRRIRGKDKEQLLQAQAPSKHYLFDAGTSTFDSSLFWFTCAFSQRGVSFNQVYGWEMTLLEPVDYWRRVPAQWKPHWHFHNIPVQSAVDSADSPLRYIRQLAGPQDFVAFKLDIDSPDMEMPIALMLRDDSQLAALVDEFFFELHFRCEVMTSCGWGKRVPSESHGLPLLRSQVLRYFIALRSQGGIRAHIWP